MKKTILFAVIAAGVCTSATATDVNGYTRNDGTYVQPYHRTAPDNTIQNNYSTQGNTNPYTGQAGTVNPYQQQYQQPQEVQQQHHHNNLRQSGY